MELMFAHARSLRLWWASSRFPLTLRSGASGKLCSLEDLSPEQRHNHHILTGYRRCRSHYECLLSLLQWHNETVNIWSNLLALAFLLALLVEDYAGGRFARLGVGLGQRALVTAMTLSYAAMLLLSSVYHMLNCTSQARGWYRLDFAGVWLSVVAYVVGIHGAPVSRLLAVRAMGWFALYSLLPLAHYALFYGDPALVARTLPGHLTVLVLLALSLFVFVTKFPERRWPGKVDYLGSSHQIWHVGVGICVLLAHSIQLAYVTPL
ncbi:hypothetical protein MTO96_009041 [Rhipicephalus appendiculatus]